MKNLEQHVKHRDSCIFRPVFCLHWFEAGEVCEEKILFKDYNDHLITFHENNDHLDREDEELDEWIASFKIEEADWKKYQAWSPMEILDTDGNLFYTVGCIANKSFNFMIVFYGSPKKAKRFSCTCSLENKDGEKFSYTGKIHTLDEKKDEIIASDSLFKIGKNAVMRSLDEDSDFEITFTISEEKTGY